jgi:hypothetical protein
VGVLWVLTALLLKDPSKDGILPADAKKAGMPVMHAAGHQQCATNFHQFTGGLPHCMLARSLWCLSGGLSCSCQVFLLPSHTAERCTPGWVLAAFGLGALSALKCSLLRVLLWCALLDCTESYSRNQAMTMQCSMCWTGLVALPLPLCLRSAACAGRGWWLAAKYHTCLVVPQAALQQAAKDPLTTCSRNTATALTAACRRMCNSTSSQCPELLLAPHVLSDVEAANPSQQRKPCGGSGLSWPLLSNDCCKFLRWLCPTVPMLFKSHSHHRCMLCLPFA